MAASVVFAALVFVATYVFVISIPSTSGYFNLGETIIYITALIFGATTGALAGGIGAMVADIMLGYAHFAPATLVIKGVEGAIVGTLNKRLRGRFNKSLSSAIAVVVGGLEMVLGYFVYEQLVLGYPFALALAEIPFNLMQMSVGLIIAIPVVAAIQRAFPQLKS
ncbi:MAG: ECF transporter S component [Candidatus Bathyarchaeota archaeon]|nr:ECF transporter S component [Candidatus Bathyarchaeota archaeon]